MTVVADLTQRGSRFVNDARLDLTQLTDGGPRSLNAALRRHCERESRPAGSRGVGNYTQHASHRGRGRVARVVTADVRTEGGTAQARRASTADGMVMAQESSHRRTEVAADHSQSQDFGTRLHGHSHVHRFGRHHTIAVEHQQARLARDPARAQLAAPVVALSPEHRYVSRHVEARIIAEPAVARGYLLRPRQNAEHATVRHAHQPDLACDVSNIAVGFQGWLLIGLLRDRGRVWRRHARSIGCSRLFPYLRCLWTFNPLMKCESLWCAQVATEDALTEDLCTMVSRLTVNRGFGGDYLLAFVDHEATGAGRTRAEHAAPLAFSPQNGIIRSHMTGGKHTGCDTDAIGGRRAKHDGFVTANRPRYDVCRSTNSRNPCARSSASSAESTGTSTTGSSSFSTQRNAGHPGSLLDCSSHANDPARHNTARSSLKISACGRTVGRGASVGMSSTFKSVTTSVTSKCVGQWSLCAVGAGQSHSRSSRRPRTARRRSGQTE